jgi:hypothetical protein
LRKLTCPSDRLVEVAENIAWDVIHFVERRRLAGPNGRGRSFLVPYTLTFDRGLEQFRVS